MTFPPFPAKKDLTIQFAHVAYSFEQGFAARNTGIRHFQTKTAEDTLARVPEADVLVISGLWSPDLLDHAEKLRFVQATSVGYEQFDLEDLRRRGIRFANGTGINRNAVAEHSLSLILSFTRQLHIARDNQQKHHWRGMIADKGAREQELGGKTTVIFGMGDIGERIALLARAFGMHVIGIKRDITTHGGNAHEVLPPERFHGALPGADFVVLACPLTPETNGLIGEQALSAMPPHCRLINVARGRCVDEPALVASLERGEIAGAALDTFIDEPLPDASPLWDFPNVIVTPHTGGETELYEENLFDLLLENLNLLWKGDAKLRNERT